MFVCPILPFEGLLENALIWGHRNRKLLLNIPLVALDILEAPVVVLDSYSSNVFYLFIIPIYPSRPHLGVD